MAPWWPPCTATVSLCSTALYTELTASDYNSLKLLQTDVLTELVA